MLITLIVFILVLSVLVFVHEAGHFWTARKFGVKVDEFGFGLPPRIVGVRRINGKFEVVGAKTITGPTDPTIYSLNWIPVGGFVKIKGENGEDADSEDSFGHKKIWQRCMVLVAGVVMNAVLCMALLAIGFGFGMPTVLSDGGSKGQIISEPKIQVVEVIEGSSAKDVGIKAGDIIANVDGQKFDTIDGLRNYLTSKKNVIVKVEIVRSGNTISKDVTVKQNQDTWGMGVGLMETGIVRYPWYLAIWQGIKMTYVWFITIVVGLAMIIKNLIMGTPVGVEVAGPVGIAALTGQAARMGIIYLLQFTALLSINLAIINILPFPALDGGRILFLIIEKIRGKAMKQRLENLIHNTGFLLLMLLIIFVTYRDLAHYGSKIVGTVKSLF